LISVIVPTIRSKIVAADQWPRIQKVLGPSELIISRGLGVASARNRGAWRASGDRFLFVDDDVVVSDYWFSKAKEVKEGMFMMTFSDHFPSTRLLAITRKDFLRLGGFDIRIKLSGEDRDFYLRAVDLGLRALSIPIASVYHIPHVIRARRRGWGWKTSLELVWVMLRHRKRHPEMLAYELYTKIRYLRVRSLLYELLAIVVVKVKGRPNIVRF